MDVPAWRLTFVFAAAVAAILAGELLVMGAAAWCLTRVSSVELPAIRAMTWHQSPARPNASTASCVAVLVMLQSWCCKATSMARTSVGTLMWQLVLGQLGA